MGEHHNGIVGVTGSIPVRSTIFTVFILQSKHTEKQCISHIDSLIRKIQKHFICTSKYIRNLRP